jgi:nickel/cobalt transporter (NiCoT) family protein
MVGMMITDTMDSLIAFRIIRQTNRLGQSASRVMGWVIVSLAYGFPFMKHLRFSSHGLNWILKL